MKTAPAAALIENLAMADFTGEASPFAGLGFKADAWKAYVTFDICQSLPALAGPVQSGNWVGYFADTLAASHGSLLHQQFNLRHAVKAYNGPVKAGQAPAIARDRIVGCVVATSFPKAPRSWMNAQNPDGATGCITACAVIFQLAEGVPKLLGDHLTSRQKQSVSIECITGLDNIGIWQASTRTLAPIDAPPDAFLPALAYEDAQGQPYPGLPHVGQLNGEQLAVVANNNLVHLHAARGDHHVSVLLRPPWLTAVPRSSTAQPGLEASCWLPMGCRSTLTAASDRT